MMTTATYSRYRGQLETYFDRTASKAWEQLTSLDSRGLILDVPLNRFRANYYARSDEPVRA